MTTPLHVLVITSEWPTPERPQTTPFIKRQVDFLRAAGVAVEVFHFKGRKNPLNYLRAWLRVQRKLSRESYNLVHAQFGQSALLAFPRRLPLVVTFRGSDLLGHLRDKDAHPTLRGKILQFICKIIAVYADAVIVVAEHMKRHLYSSTRVYVIPSGIDFNLFRCLPQHEARKKVGLPQNERLVLFVGRPGWAGKRFEIAERAMELLKLNLPARLVVAGNVDHEAIPVYMNACDVLVFTSAQEGSPNVIKEALACNLPIVSVAVGDVALRIGKVQGCEVCADDRPETIAVALERVLQRGKRINGRETVKDLDERQTTREVIDVYQSILVQKHGGEISQMSVEINGGGYELP